MKSYFSINPKMPHGRRLRRLQEVKDLSPTASKLELEKLDPQSLAVIEPAVLDEVRAGAVNSGRLFEHSYRDRGGRLISTYEGDPKAWMAPFMARPIPVRINPKPDQREETVKLGPGQRVMVVDK